MSELAPVFRSDNLPGVFLLLSSVLIIATLYILYRNLLQHSQRVERERRVVLGHFRSLLSASRSVQTVLTRIVDDLRHQVQDLQHKIQSLHTSDQEQAARLASLEELFVEVRALQSLVRSLPQKPKPESQEPDDV
jgi:peptidoglycan hydrolase CwlO-like protein